MADDEFFTVPTGVVTEDDVPRDGYGRYMLPDPGGNPNNVSGRTRVTTLAGSMDNGFGLTMWRRRTVIRGMGLRPDLMARAGAADPNDPGYDKLLDSIEAAAFEAGGGSSGSNLGSAQHAVFDRYFGKGESLDTIAEYFHADIKAVEAELAKKRIKLLPGYNERVVYCKIYDRAGCIDSLAELDDGTVAVLDWKTEKDPVAYPEGKTIQLSYYGNSDVTMNYETHQYEPLPPIRRDIAIVIWCRPGSGEAKALRVPIDVGWVGARVAEDNRAWRQQKIVISEYFPGTGLASPVVVQPSPTAYVRDDTGSQGIPAPTHPNEWQERVANTANAVLSEVHQRIGSQHAPGVVTPEAVAAVTNGTHPATMAQAGFTSPAPAQPPGQPVVGPGTPHAAADMAGPPAGSVPSSRPPAPVGSGKNTPPAEYVKELIDRSSGGIDEEAFYIEMQEELANLSKKDQLQPMLRIISPGINENDLKKHRGPLADMLVTIIKQQRNLREGQTHQSETQYNTAEAFPGQTQSQPNNGIIDMSFEGVMRAISEAPNVDRLTAIYHQWAHTYGPQSWTGQILDAANAQMTKIQPAPTH